MDQGSISSLSLYLYGIFSIFCIYYVQVLTIPIVCGASVLMIVVLSVNDVSSMVNTTGGMSLILLTIIYLLQIKYSCLEYYKRVQMHVAFGILASLWVVLHVLTYTLNIHGQQKVEAMDFFIPYQRTFGTLATVAFIAMVYSIRKVHTISIFRHLIISLLCITFILFHRPWASYLCIVCFTCFIIYIVQLYNHTYKYTYESSVHHRYIELKVNLRDDQIPVKPFAVYYICFPTISTIYWYPFTLAFYQQGVGTFYIKKVGRFTRNIELLYTTILSNEHVYLYGPIYQYHVDISDYRDIIMVVSGSFITLATNLINYPNYFEDQHIQLFWFSEDIKEIELFLPKISTYSNRCSIYCIHPSISNPLISPALDMETIVSNLNRTSTCAIIGGKKLVSDMIRQYKHIRILD